MAATRTILPAVAVMTVLSTASAAIYNIVFKYSPQAHDVLEVSKADYDSCTTASPVTTLNSGNDVVTLIATGTRYFICGFPDHCAGGMKVKIDVMPGSSSSPAPASGPNASNAAPPTPVSAATNVEAMGLGLVVLLAIAGLMA
ncbi:mavicyanin-like [Triticum dicoccoides]|uniref:mavicyanin-like n=1 Tax=Triticum dicoccoides TaxID=85692 RepID=UPI00189004E5|nr:mavicyanin-like [Triticum dicoccoides]XP_044320981.1 mavicyanin-like [Triticum aestivum]